MKNIEPICGSSLDHFLILDSTTPTEIPTVTFTVKNASAVNITITDIDNTEWEGITLTGTPDGVITQNSFATKNNAISTGLSLLECLKKNTTFYNFSTPTIQGSNLVITCNIDMSRNYLLTSSNTNNISIAATQGTTTITKYIVDMDIETVRGKSNLSLDKYSIDDEVSFNLTAPFSAITEKYPIKCTLFSYITNGIDTTMNTLNVNEFYVLPTTLHKFDWVDFNTTYLKDVAIANPKPIMTNNTNKTINYGEMVVLSFLTNDPNTKLRKRYYTNSGRFLTQEDSYVKKHINFIRTDFYDLPAIEDIESNYNTQVGYVLYNILDSGNNIISNDLRYDVVPSCNPNNIIYFINEVGGVDSFNFLGDAETEYTIEEQLTYSTTPTRPFTNNKVIEQVKSKYNEITHTCATVLINKQTADWLNELNKSKYVFLYDGSIETRIIVKKFDIETTYDTEQYELKLEYQRSDNNIRI